MMIPKGYLWISRWVLGQLKVAGRDAIATRVRSIRLLGTFSEVRVFGGF